MKGNSLQPGLPQPYSSQALNDIYNLLFKDRNLPVSGEKEILSVIIEVGLPEGLDVVAAFKDGSARYINYSGKLIIWETRTNESDELISQLFSDSMDVVNKIGPWTEARRPAPTAGNIRLSFIVSDGLYFGEGPFEVLQNDPMGGPVIADAIKLMSFLIDQPAPSEK